MGFNHHVMEVDWKGIRDKHVDDLPKGMLISEYMKNKGFKRVKNSANLFKKGKRILYVSYGGNDNPEDQDPKIKHYYDSFKL